MPLNLYGIYYVCNHKDISALGLLRKSPILTVFVLAVLLFFSERMSGCTPVVNLGGFISFCQGNSITLSAQNNSATYAWSTGANTPTITVANSGVFWVSVTNVCGTTTDTVVVQVDVPLNPDLGPDRDICSTGDSLVVPFINGATYNWTGGGTPNGNKLYVNQAGTYSVSINNACGNFGDQVTLSVKNPQPLNAGADIFECTNTPQTLQATNGFDMYTWYRVGTAGNVGSGSNKTTLNVTVSGVYYVEAMDACGLQRDTVDVWFSQGPRLNLGNTVTLCGGASGTLTANANRGTYLWSTGATTKSISVSTPGSYWVRFIDPCGTFYDTVQVVTGAAATVNLGGDKTICANKGIVLNAGNPGSTYLWSNSTSNQTLVVNQPGVYWVGVNNGCGFAYDTVNITVIPAPIIQIADTVYKCRTGAVTLDAGNWGPNSGYVWSNGTNTQTTSYTTTGLQTLQVYNQCDTLFHQFHIIPVDPINVDLGPDSITCGQTIVIDLAAQGIDPRKHSFRWSNNVNTPHNVFSTSGTYWVEVSNACGSYTDTVEFTFLPTPTGYPKRVVNICNNPGTRWLGIAYDTSITYLWNTGSDSSAIFVTQPGTYWVTAYNTCDTISDTIDVVYDTPLNPNLGNDTTVCEPTIVYYDMSVYGADSVLWSTGSRNGGLPISTSGTYWVNLYNACGVFSDTVVVTVNRRPRATLLDTAICVGGSYTFDATQPPNIPRTTYLWNTGDTTASITVSAQGTYTVTMTNECGSRTSQAFLRVDQPIPPINLGNDTIFCDGTLLLNPSLTTNARYLWQDGSTDSTLLIDKSGTYHVQVTNACNTQVDTINVLITGPPQLILGTETRFCFGSTLTLNAQNPGSTYLWNTGETSQTVVIDSAGIYWVTITNDCGQLTDSINVIVEYILDDVDLGKDTTICLGETLRLTTQYPDVQHLWTGGVTDTFLDVTTTGIYWGRVTNTCGSWVDSIYVEVIEPPVFSLGADSVICAIDGSVELFGPDSMLTYEWDGGVASTQNFTATTPGFHYLTVTNLCFSYTDTIYLEPEYPIEITLGNDTALCQTNPITLDAGIDRYQVFWNDGTRGRFKQITKSGLYIARSRNSCGVFFDSIYVDVQAFLNPPNFDTTVCLDDTVEVNLSGLTYPFEWFDGGTQVTRKFFNPDTVSLFITNECGRFEKDIIIQKVDCTCPFHVPNAFTPNGDGKNETFFVQHNCPLTSYQIMIFNRWGRLVYKGKDIDDPWNGYMDGQLQPQGVYTYQIIYEYEVYGLQKVEYKTGTLTLLQ